ncbi:MAG: hypothetical protein AB7M05_05890 [Alphaproteobacteria bacterium]
MTALEIDGWDSTLSSIDELKKQISRSKTSNINSADIKAYAQSVVQTFFRMGRVSLLRYGFQDGDFVDLDENFHKLNNLCRGNNKKTSYLSVIKSITDLSPAIFRKREFLVGQRLASSGRATYTAQQQRIIQTLNTLVPSAAFSLQQAIDDLSHGERVSYRGIAAELREALRETVDHLAPDSAVMSANGFRLEAGRSSPTIRQKVSFILNAREQSDAIIRAAQDTSSNIESGADRIARSVYTRGSVSTHISTSRREVVQLLRYSEAILAELLALD